MDLKNLAPLSQRLNAATDELNVVLQTIQDKLNALSLGVEVWLDDSSRQWLAPLQIISSYSENEAVAHRVIEVKELGYSRFADGWALAVRDARYSQILEEAGGYPEASWEFDDPEPVHLSEPKPLLRASRAVRTVAVDRIPQLVEKIAAAAQAVIDAVEKAKRIAESLE